MHDPALFIQKAGEITEKKGRGGGNAKEQRFASLD